MAHITRSSCPACPALQWIISPNMEIACILRYEPGNSLCTLAEGESPFVWIMPHCTTLVLPTESVVQTINLEAKDASHLHCHYPAVLMQSLQYCCWYAPHGLHRMPKEREHGCWVSLAAAESSSHYHQAMYRAEVYKHCLPERCELLAACQLAISFSWMLRSDAHVPLVKPRHSSGRNLSTDSCICSSVRNRTLAI